MAQDDTGLAQRGLLLLTAITALVVVVLWILFQRPEAAPPAELSRPEALLPALVLPDAGFPGSVAWPVLYQFAEELPSPPGWEVRYNAVITLARRGSDQLPWATVREMLDESRQMRNYRVPLLDGKETADEVAARTTVLGTLKAVTAWHERRKAAGRPTTPPDAARLVAMLEELASSPYPELRTHAERARDLFSGPALEN